MEKYLPEKCGGSREKEGYFFTRNGPGSLVLKTGTLDNAMLDRGVFHLRRCRFVFLGRILA